jgi:hypothetical protein
MARETKRDTSGHAPDEASVALGHGILRWPEILRQANRDHVAAYFIEDESPRAAEQVPVSLQYLTGLGY